MKSFIRTFFILFLGISIYTSSIAQIHDSFPLIQNDSPHLVKPVIADPLLKKDSEIAVKPISAEPIYHMNYWITTSIFVVGLATDAPAISRIKAKSVISDQELDNLDRVNMNSIDKWALQQDYSQAKSSAKYSDYTMTGLLVFLPALTFADKPLRKDWFKILMMYYETQTVTFSIYNYSFLGPTFINRYRPMTYYENAAKGDRISGWDRSSFYSGHVASTAAASFFMAKVYADYHPELRTGSRILLYGAASVPPLVISYFRVKSLAHFPSDCMVGFGLGALCGIIIPELHKHHNRNMSFGVFSTPVGSGLSMSWNPIFK